MTNKTCNKCHKTRLLEFFEKDSRNKDGLQGICSFCRKEEKQRSRDARMRGENITPVSSKICNKCDLKKPISEFFRDAGISDGHATICKSCKGESSQKWREDNREKYNADMRAYNKKRYKKIRLQRYKLSVEQHDKMMKEQNGKCKICECPPKGKRPLVVDHHHDTGVIRGLLCYGCNRAIAILDRPELLAKAITYLKT